MKQHWNRILAMCVALLLCVGLLPGAPASAAESTGACGDNLTWSFADGRLTISGSGDMTDYNQVDLPPWYEFREQIYYISLPEGLTGVGNMAFYDCVNLTAATMPSTLTRIGKMAFCQCTSLAYLSLNAGLQTIGRSAFELCEKLQDLRLPETVTQLGYHAFYACNGLRYVKIPASVTEMDSGVFAYCQSLISAEIAAPLEVVPSWTFYGCDSLTSIALHQHITGAEVNAFAGCEKLTTVYYAGSEENAENLRQQIGEDEENFAEYGEISSETPENGGSVTDYTSGEDGSFVVTDTTVSQSEDATVSTSTTVENGDTEVAIDATVVTEDGWEEVMDAIEQGRQDAGESAVEVNVVVPDGTGVPTDVINMVTGTNTTLTVQSGDGSQFTVSGTTLEGTQEPGQVQFSYSAARLETPDFSQLNGVAAYSLTFAHSSSIRVEVLIRLPEEYARNTATLYQVVGESLVVLQSVMVDTSGYAHFYLASVDATQTYRIGINVSDVDPNNVIVPEEFYGEYGITANYPDFSQYVLTGQTSSLGVNVNQMTWIMFAVMGGCAVAIGVVMYIWNKRRLKMGYVPDIDEEDMEEFSDEDE